MLASYSLHICTHKHLTSSHTPNHFGTQGEQLVSTDLPKGSGSIAQISFHPYDSDRLATTVIPADSGSGTTQVWHIKRLWEKRDFTSRKVRVVEVLLLLHYASPVCLCGSRQCGVMHLITILTTNLQVLTDADHPSTTHCWFPGGLYLGEREELSKITRSLIMD